MARSVSEIQAELDDAYAARRRILRGGQAKGQDGASKSEASLKDINELIATLTNELSLARGCGGFSFTPTVGT